MMKINSSSVSNYFGRLREKTHEIDENINWLEEIWKTPQLMIGGYGVKNENSTACLEKWSSYACDIKDAVEAFELPELDTTGSFLKEVEVSYQELKKDCDNLDLVFAEYEQSPNIQNSQHQYNSIENLEEISDIKIEFTPE